MNERFYYEQADVAGHHTSRATSGSGFATFLSFVYGWMFLGLILTAGTTFMVLQSPELANTVANNLLWFFLGEIALVIAISGMVNTMSLPVAALTFLAYSAINGLTLGILVAMYSPISAITAFLTTAGTFGTMTLFGLVTKKDLSSWGSLLFMGLIGIIFASLINIFFASSMISILISAVAVFIFVGLIAYDTQKLKHFYRQGMEYTNTGQKIAIMGALTLYLDFVILFQHLLYLLGGSRD
jgi:FtsH-binding integral membrane protein